MVTTIPRLLLMPIGGVVADRFKRSQIMIVSGSTRALLIFIMALCMMTNALSIPLLLVFAFLFGTLEDSIGQQPHRFYQLSFQRNIYHKQIL